MSHEVDITGISLCLLPRLCKSEFPIMLLFSHPHRHPHPCALFLIARGSKLHASNSILNSLGGRGPTKLTGSTRLNSISERSTQNVHSVESICTLLNELNKKSKARCAVHKHTSLTSPSALLSKLRLLSSVSEMGAWPVALGYQRRRQGEREDGERTLGLTGY